MFNKLLIVKLTVLVSLFAFVFTSCTKDDIVKKDDSVKKSSDEIRSTVPGGTDPTYLLDVAANEWCDKDGTNCCSVGTVYEEDPNLKAFEIAISNGSSGISDYFNGNDYLILFPSLESDPYQMLTKLQSGNYEMEKLIDPNNSNHIIYQAYNADDDNFGLQLNFD